MDIFVIRWRVEVVCLEGFEIAESKRRLRSDARERVRTDELCKIGLPAGSRHEALRPLAQGMDPVNARTVATGFGSGLWFREGP